MQESPRRRAARTRADTPALLKGLLFGPDGAAFSPTHTRKGDRLYRYYVSQTVLKHGAGACPVDEQAELMLRVPCGHGLHGIAPRFGSQWTKESDFTIRKSLASTSIATTDQCDADGPDLSQQALDFRSFQ